MKVLETDESFKFHQICALIIFICYNYDSFDFSCYDNNIK